MRRFVQAFTEDTLPSSLPREPMQRLTAGEGAYNIGKGDDAWIVLRHEDVPVARRSRWGLVPAWSKAPETRYTTVTARLERASKSRIFGKPWKARHCVVPMSGYYKWDRASKPPLPYFIHAVDGQVLFAAGLWEEWRSEDASLHSFAILTHPNDAIPQPLTPDGPIFLTYRKSLDWLAGPTLFAESFLKSARQPALAAYAVSSAHRDRSRDDYTLVEPRAASEYLEPAAPAFDEDEDE